MWCYAYSNVWVLWSCGGAWCILFQDQALLQHGLLQELCPGSEGWSSYPIPAQCICGNVYIHTQATCQLILQQWMSHHLCVQTKTTGQTAGQGGRHKRKRRHSAYWLVMCLMHLLTLMMIPGVSHVYMTVLKTYNWTPILNDSDVSIAPASCFRHVS